MNIIITNHSYDRVISGGDVIVAEFAKCWKKSGHFVIVATHKTGAKFFYSRGLKKSMLAITISPDNKKFNTIISAPINTLSAILQSIFWKTRKPDVIFSSSWMWTDFIPALILKIRFRHARFVVGSYLLLSHPNTKSYGASLVSRWIFWFVYLTGTKLMRLTANMIWTSSKLDAKNLHQQYGVNTYAILGGADVSACRKIRNQTKKYDAVFLGRFHPQKNILELIDIWKTVTLALPNAKLLLIGDGFLKEAIIKRIKRQKLEDRIIVGGMLDGDKKFKKLGHCKIFISSSHFDSGNLALDEALTCGMPGIIYNSPLLDYPKGVIKISCFNKNKFAKEIISLLRNKSTLEKLSKEGIVFGEKLDWKIGAKKALSSLY